MKLALAALAVLSLAACDKAKDKAQATFGSSYNECLLLNLKSQNVASAELVTQSCRREFERTGNKELFANLAFHSEAGQTWFEGTLDNPSSDEIVTKEFVSITTYKDADHKETSDFSVWTLNENIEPGGKTAVTLSGSLKDMNNGFTVVAHASRVIPAKSSN